MAKTLYFFLARRVSKVTAKRFKKRPAFKKGWVVVQIKTKRSLTSKGAENDWM
jgi:hypothetical protein